MGTGAGHANRGARTLDEDRDRTDRTRKGRRPARARQPAPAIPDDGRDAVALVAAGPPGDLLVAIARQLTALAEDRYDNGESRSRSVLSGATVNDDGGVTFVEDEIGQDANDPTPAAGR